MSMSGWAIGARSPWVVGAPPCWWCHVPTLSGSYDRFARFACYPCQEIQEAEALATRRQAEAQAEAGHRLALAAEVREREAMWGLDPLP